MHRHVKSGVTEGKVRAFGKRVCARGRLSVCFGKHSPADRRRREGTGRLLSCERRTQKTLLPCTAANTATAVVSPVRSVMRSSPPICRLPDRGLQVRYKWSASVDLRKILRPIPVEPLQAIRRYGRAAQQWLTMV
ncbi:unnamed protein product [Heligmosomoides polygyrus]|uniref:Uncharacterized protein n=1 Tax=Heligmosomoides polygyrus TaxID=6339 RepID=A0A183FFR4_HELPZ|nr:unnamed protein product [Heligmosomoides polygyrus]